MRTCRMKTPQLRIAACRWVYHGMQVCVFRGMQVCILHRADVYCSTHVCVPVCARHNAGVCPVACREYITWTRLRKA